MGGINLRIQSRDSNGVLLSQHNIYFVVRQNIDYSAIFIVRSYSPPTRAQHSRPVPPPGVVFIAPFPAIPTAFSEFCIRATSSAATPEPRAPHTRPRLSCRSVYGHFPAAPSHPSTSGRAPLPLPAVTARTLYRLLNHTGRPGAAAVRCSAAARPHRPDRNGL